ncbi:MAG TPA: IS21 family transposase [Kofleriaceae bacterium]|nr:IS21 family transposase [Kofleriaceae bacterium]
MANVLSDEKRQQVEALGRLGWTLRRIQRETGVRRETASDYLRAAGIAIRSRGGAPPKPATSAEVITDPNSKPATSVEVITDSGNSKPATSAVVITDSTPRSASSCEPYRELIERFVGDGRHAMSIWQELIEKHGFTARYAAVQRFVRGLRETQPPEARVVIATTPGEEAQVDYGDGPMVRYAATGKYRRTRLFLMTLAHSRKAVRLLTWQSSSKIWAQLHEQSFRRLGGATATVVLDNLREGVITPDVYDPLLNPLYREVLAHYGAVGLPCRVRDPDRKGKVESGIAHTQKALRGLRFESLEEAQKWLDNWDARWADTRIHGTTKRQVAAMFADERPHLRSLPLEPFRYYSFGERAVHLDGFVEVLGAYYAPPPGWIGRSVRVQWDEQHVRLLDPTSGALLREHLVADRGRHRIRAEDQPSRTPPDVAVLFMRAHGIGPATGAIADAEYATNRVHGIRRTLGLCSLAKKHGATAVERAANVALDAGALTYRAVKACLVHHQAAPLALRQVDPLIRGLTEYRDLVCRITGEPS